MVKFTDENKQVQEFNNKYFEEGVHPVKISTVQLGKTDSDKEYLEFGVVADMDGNDDREDSVRFWFSSDGAINFSFNRIREIFVHNAADDQKDATRTKFDAIADTEKLEAACQKVLIGKEAWLSVYENKERPYTNDKGETKYSFDKNLTGYEPKPKNISTGTPAPDNTQPITVTNEDGSTQQIADF